MSVNKPEQKPKERTTAQFWARLERLNRNRAKINAKIDAEAADITAKLEAVLHRTTQ
jgi:hypothetical protein